MIKNGFPSYYLVGKDLKNMNAKPQRIIKIKLTRLIGWGFILTVLAFWLGIIIHG